MAMGIDAPPSWRGWDDLEPSVTGATSARTLDTDVRSGWFPGIRSWMALGGPLELLSPLAVLRVLFGAGVIGFAVVGHVGSAAGGRAVVATCIATTTFVLWLVLLSVRSIRPNPCRLLSLYWTTSVAALIVVDRSGQTSVILGFLLVPSTVFVSLFFRRRVVLWQLGVAFAALWVAFAAGQGVPTGFLMAVLAVAAMSTAPFTVLLGARASRRSGLVDPETGLPNALGLVEELGTSADPGTTVAVVAFGGIGGCREALGYKAGAELLRRAVEDLGRVLPDGALIGRVEGDEIVVVVPGRTVHPGADRTAASDAAIADRLRSSVDRRRYLVGGVELWLNPHVGLVDAPSDGRSLPELFRHGAQSARRAADLGVPWVRWSGDSDAVSVVDLELLADLRAAVVAAGPDSGLHLAYQMQFAPGADVATSVEALLRWDRRGHGPVGPDRFIPLAERSGLVPQVTGWVLQEALDAQSRWRQEGIDLPVSVNVSAKDLADPDLVARILDGLRSRGLPTSCLTVEVTESAVTDPDQALAVLGPLRAHGVRVSVDDFGTGFTSLAALPALPLDELKIDQRFVRQSIVSPADDAIVATTCDLAHRLGLVVVAEGVEDATIAARMAEHGVDLLQGYHFARPLDERALVAAQLPRSRTRH
jgi:EAL domain-containing protein (putative c-di-GMP-specific phosphodiesterase class I)/GGDEF domain-containing protein